MYYDPYSIVIQIETAKTWHFYKKIAKLGVVFLFHLVWRTARFVDEKNKKTNTLCTSLKNLTIPSLSAFLTLESLTCRQQPCQSCSTSNRADRGSQHIEQRVDANVFSTKRVTKENKAENGKKIHRIITQPILGSRIRVANIYAARCSAVKPSHTIDWSIRYRWWL